MLNFALGWAAGWFVALLGFKSAIESFFEGF